MQKEETNLTKTGSKPSPAFVQAEKMFEKIAAINTETASRAYDFFVERGSQRGSHLEDWLHAEASTLRPAPVRIIETKDTVVVTIAVPGFKADEIEVVVYNDLLIVGGETTSEEMEDGQSTFYSEWRSDRFMRKLPLPGKVGSDNIETELKGGVLRLILKKTAEIEAPKVAVQAG